jgi:very-short-patch-repair endonuclease
MKGVSFEYPMYYGAKPSIFKLARELKKNETEAEKFLWSKLNKNQIKVFQFRRQHPINMFIADFYCAKLKLVIEVDGNIHEITDYKEHDNGRSDYFDDLGITVIRFTNEQILNEINYTASKIEETISLFQALQSLSPQVGGCGIENRCN